MFQSFSAAENVPSDNQILFVSLSVIQLDPGQARCPHFDIVTGNCPPL